MLIEPPEVESTSRRSGHQRIDGNEVAPTVSNTKEHQVRNIPSFEEVPLWHRLMASIR